MGGEEYAAVLGQERGLFPGEAAPEHEHGPLRQRGRGEDDGVGELLPAEGRVAVGLASLHAESGVQQQYALTRPAGQIAGLGYRPAQIVLYFLENGLTAKLGWIHSLL